MLGLERLRSFRVRGRIVREIDSVREIATPAIVEPLEYQSHGWAAWELFVLEPLKPRGIS